MEQQQEKARQASSLYMWGTTSSGASDERRARGGAQVCTSSLRYVGVAVSDCESKEPLYRWPAASPEASVASEAAAWCRCDPSSGRWLSGAEKGYGTASSETRLLLTQFKVGKIVIYVSGCLVGSVCMCCGWGQCVVIICFSLSLFDSCVPCCVP